MKAHVIKDGAVVNTIVVNALSDISIQNAILIEATAGKIGDLWDGTIFTTQDKTTAEEQETEQAKANVEASQKEIVSSDIADIKTYTELDTFIDNNIKSIEDAKDYLKKLSRVVKAFITYMNISK